MIPSSTHDENATVRSQAYLRKKFQTWYSANKPPRVNRMVRRELAFTSWEWTGMSRHHQMSRKDLKWYVAHHVPKAVYNSAAYFQDPSARTMKEKGWMGCDLIFDIDCDHLVGSATMNLEDQLEQARQRTLSILYDYLHEDFGISEKHTTVTFSGARGYHIHVRESPILQLGTQERREIVDYIAATGLSTVTEAAKRYTKLNGEGWADRLAHALDVFLIQLSTLDVKDRRKWLHEIQRDYDLGDAGLSDRTLSYMARKFDQVNKWYDQAMLHYLTDHQRAWVYRAAAQMAAVPDFDKQVTYDIHRLIRVPGSLHARTGFLCRPVPDGQLDTYDPFQDAIAFHSSNELDIHLISDASGCINNNSFDLKPGQHTVPECVGIFLIAQKLAVIV